MKFGIDFGHNCPPDTGASGLAQEDNLTKEVGLKVISMLTKLGHSAVNLTPSRASSVSNSLSQRTSKANSTKCDYLISIHFNAFNGKAHGAEIFAASSAGRRIASPIQRNLVNLGFRDRGIKNGSHLAVIRNSRMPAILVEVCFLDNRNDMSIYTADKAAIAIVEGLTGQSAPVSASAQKEIPVDRKSPKILQENLNRLLGSKLDVDGIIGVRTREAIKQFNQLLGIGNGDAASATTHRAIAEVLEEAVLRVNHASGHPVLFLQGKLGAELDGIYDMDTLIKVKEFQKAHGLTVDGIVGTQTWGKLLHKD